MNHVYNPPKVDCITEGKQNWQRKDGSCTDREWRIYKAKMLSHQQLSLNSDGGAARVRNCIEQSIPKDRSIPDVLRQIETKGMKAMVSGCKAPVALNLYVSSPIILLIVQVPFQNSRLRFLAALVAQIHAPKLTRSLI